MAEAMLAHGNLLEKNLVSGLDEMQQIIDDDAADRLY